MHTLALAYLWRDVIHLLLCCSLDSVCRSHTLPLSTHTSRARTQLLSPEQQRISASSSSLVAKLYEAPRATGPRERPDKPLTYVPSKRVLPLEDRLDTFRTTHTTSFTKMPEHADDVDHNVEHKGRLFGGEQRERNRSREDMHGDRALSITNSVGGLAARAISSGKGTRVTAAGRVLAQRPEGNLIHHPSDYTSVTANAVDNKHFASTHRLTHRHPGTVKNSTPPAGAVFPVSSGMMSQPKPWKEDTLCTTNKADYTPWLGLTRTMPVLPRGTKGILTHPKEQEQLPATYNGNGADDGPHTSRGESGRGADVDGQATARRPANKGGLITSTSREAFKFHTGGNAPRSQVACRCAACRCCL